MGGEDREQEAECESQEELCQLYWTLGQGRREGACGAEAQGFRPDQEGLSTLHQGEGVLEELRLSCEVFGAQTQRSASSRCGHSTPVERMALLVLPLTKGQW